jgi:ABC-2 type transport system ATP-binding protein
VRVSRSVTLLTASAIGLAGAAMVTAPATAATPAFTSTPLTFTVQTGPADNPVTCTILGDLRVPAGVSAARPAPGAVLSTNGFGGGKDDTGANGDGSYGARFAEQGYVTLAYAGLGFGGSSCNIYVDDPAYDGKAGSQLVSFLGGAKGIAKTADGKPFDIAGLVRLDKVAHDGTARPNDPRVAMIGGSYGGQIQFAIAGVDPRMDALVPVYTWNDLGYSLTPNNAGHASSTDVSSSTPGVWKEVWQALFFGLGAGGNVLYQGSTPNVCGDYPAWVCQAVAEEATLGYPSAATIEHAKQVSVSSYAGKIRIPVLFSQGQQDSLFNLNEAIDTYSTLKAQGNTVRMLWQSWGHTVGSPVPGELATGTLEPGTAKLTDTVQGRIYTDWMAHWLKDAPTDLGPAVRYFRDYAYKAPADPKNTAAALAAATAAYGASNTYPVGRPTRLLLSGGNALVPDGSKVTPGSASFVSNGAAAPTNSGEVATVTSPPIYDVPGTFATWTGAALAAPLDVAGVPVLTVRFDAPQVAAAQDGSPLGKLLLFAKLYDVAPDGTRVLIRNLVGAVRVPDVTKPTNITLPGIVHRFDKGHQVQLVLSASDATYKGMGIAGPVTVNDSAAAPNVLTLPLAAAAARRAAPAAPARPAPAAQPAPQQLPRTGGSTELAALGALLVLSSAWVRRRRTATA